MYPSAAKTPAAIFSSSSEKLPRMAHIDMHKRNMPINVHRRMDSLPISSDLLGLSLFLEVCAMLSCSWMLLLLVKRDWLGNRLCLGGIIELIGTTFSKF